MGNFIFKKLSIFQKSDRFSGNWSGPAPGTRAWDRYLKTHVPVSDQSFGNTARGTATGFIYFPVVLGLLEQLSNDYRN